MNDKKTLPEKFTIPEDRIPKPWSQGLYDCCVAASITKVLEVINYVKTGTYTMMSKGYVYGRHSRPDKKQGGMDYSYTIPELLERGSVPEEMCPIMDELPNIVEKILALPNIDELDEVAAKNRVAELTQIKGDIYFHDNVKQLLYEKQMPLIGNMVGKRHCAVIVGWDGDKFLYHDHDGRSNLYRGKFNEAYYLEGCYDDPTPSEEPIELPEVTEIPDIILILASSGVLTNTEMWLKKCSTDVNVYWLCRKMANYIVKTCR